MRTDPHDQGHERREDPLIDLGYETKDVNLRGVAWAAFWFFMFAGAAGLAGALMFRFDLLGRGPVARPAEVRTAKLPKDAPFLQTNITTRTDIQSLRQAEDAALIETRPLPDGHVRIPIERAVNLLAQRGFQPTGNAIPAFSPGTTVPQNALSPEDAARGGVPTPTPPGGAPAPASGANRAGGG